MDYVSDGRLHVPVPLPAANRVSAALKDTDSIQQSYPEIRELENRQAFWLEDRPTDRAFPVSQWLKMRCSSPLTATAGLRWI